MNSRTTSGSTLPDRIRTLLLLALAGFAMASEAADISPLAIGLTAGREVIAASQVTAGSSDARRIVLVGGLNGADASGTAINEQLAAYAALPDAGRAFDLIAIPIANPERQPLTFPPTGAAYRENSEAHALWRWLGLNAPDLVLVVGADDAGLAAALTATNVAGVGTIPARRVPAGTDLLQGVPANLPRSPARAGIEARRLRTPREFADRLAPLYAQSFATPIYIDGMGLIAHLGLGHLEHVQQLVEPYVDGTRDSLGGSFGVSSLVLAGHLVFAELAGVTGDPRYLERARAAADFAFADDGQMLEAMPGHGEMSDAIFMGASILAAVGDLTGERRYFDMAARHIAFMNELVRRDDGLYRHSPLTDAAWARGNGFAAIGYALTLSQFPLDHPAHARLLNEYRSLMTTLADWQNTDGTWRQVVDVPGAWHETSSTAIIGFSMQRGMNRGWLDPEFEGNVERAWQGLLTRTGSDGGFIDVSESTNKQSTLDDYLLREAVAGRDPRTGSFALLFAVERAASQSPSQLPARLDDRSFRDLVVGLSEPDGFFSDENYVSNELGLHRLLPELAERFAPGGAYIGVGPEQNFSYLANLRPGIAFILDIRRQNVMEHLMYKALFELADNRAEFLSLLFSRQPPSGFDADAGVATLLGAFRIASPDRRLFDATLQAILGNLIDDHGFALDPQDQEAIAKVFTAFYRDGPDIAYVYRETDEWHPNYAQLMDLEDATGKNWSYLGSEASFARVRQLQLANLIVPVVGDFAGPKTLRAIGDYVRAHDAAIDVFYTSNVESYLFGDDLWRPFYDNVMTLPLSEDSVIIRTFFGSTARECIQQHPLIRMPLSASLVELLEDYRNGSLQSQCALVEKSR